MGMLGWVMMGLAIWHFTIWLPDRFWGGIVGALVGAIVGALFVNLAQSTVSESFPNAWQYFIGLIFIVTVLLFPSGLAGIPELIRGQLRPMPFHVGSAQAGERVGAGSALPATNTRPTIEPKEVSS